MKTARERAKAHLAVWENDFSVGLEPTVVAALLEHETDARADECAKLLVEVAPSLLPDSVAAAVARLKASLPSSSSVQQALVNAEVRVAAANGALRLLRAAESDEPKRILVEAIAWALVALAKLEAGRGGGA